MHDPSDWKQDPVVLLEKAVLPAIWKAYGYCAAARGVSGAPDIAPDQAKFDAALEMLRRGALELLKEHGVRPDPEAQALMLTAAGKMASFLKAMPVAEPALLLTQLETELVPAFEAALDAYRAVFIGDALDRHARHAVQARAAIDGLDRISKQIFFISINASVEAARAGDAGRGFVQISSDIRALSQSAQSATRDLSDLVVER